MLGQRHFADKDIKKLVEAQQKKEWEFIFLGANIDSIHVASSMGIRANRTVNYHNDSRGTQKKFSAMDNFMSAAFAVSSFADIGDDWRKEVDKDFEERKAPDEK